MENARLWSCRMMGLLFASRLSKMLWLLTLAATAAAASVRRAENTTFFNPILPGFHPDPSCIFVSDWDDTFFCATSSFNAFPGIPIHASRDLQNWKLISTSAVLLLSL